MKRKVLPFLRRGKENQPSGMPCIVLLLATVERVYEHMEKGIPGSTKRDAYIGDVSAYTA